MQLKNKPSKLEITRKCKVYIEEESGNIIYVGKVQNITESTYITSDLIIDKDQPGLHRMSVEQWLEYDKHWRMSKGEIK